MGPVEPVEADRRLGRLLGEAYVVGRVKGECPPVCVVSCVLSGRCESLFASAIRESSGGGKDKIPPMKRRACRRGSPRELA